jgi:hypothetical protein
VVVVAVRALLTGIHECFEGHPVLGGHLLQRILGTLRGVVPERRVVRKRIASRITSLLRYFEVSIGILSDLNSALVLHKRNLVGGGVLRPYSVKVLVRLSPLVGMLDFCVQRQSTVFVVASILNRELSSRSLVDYHSSSGYRVLLPVVVVSGTQDILVS